ncbi:MAG: glycosyltransferase family 2 protein, partial [Anaerolineales bacterium]|nr:glycosyltransferase family 2 protein [Anaerolineales bacterium]
MIETRVSAIITAYNSELFVEDAILSVLRQSRPVDEIVVIDDGSTDNTATVAAKFLDQGVRYFYQENQGPSAARNRGIQETSGDLLAFLDADDTWLENKNQIQVEYLLSHPKIVMVSGLRWRFDGTEDTRRVSGQTPKNSEILRRDIVIHNLIGNPSMITVRRGAFETVGLF